MNSLKTMEMKKMTKEKLNKEITEQPKITEYFKTDESNYMDINE